MQFKETFGHSPNKKSPIKKAIKEAKPKIYKKSKVEVPSRKSSRIADKDLPDGLYSGNKENMKCTTVSKSISTSVSPNPLEEISEVLPESFPCDECNKVFRYKNSLVKHTNALHTENVFGCEVCFRSFTYQTNLKRHVASEHTKSPKHKCKDCHQSFSYKHNLKTHTLKFHKREM